MSVERGTQAPAAWSHGLTDGQTFRLVQLKSMVNLLFTRQFNSDMLPVMTEEFGLLRSGERLPV